MRRESAKKGIWLGTMILTVILYGLTLLSAYGGYINPQKMTLPAIAVLLFPYFAILTLVVAVLWLLRKKFAIGCIGIALLLACGPTFSEAVPFRFHGNDSTGGNTFKLVTYNCLHMKDVFDTNTESSKSMTYLLNSGADFICLQEVYAYTQQYLTPATQAQLDSLAALYPYNTAKSHIEEKFFSKYPFRQLDYKLEKARYYGNFGVYRVYMDNDSLTVINVHLPSFALSNKEKQLFIEMTQQTKRTIKEFEGPVLDKMGKAFQQRAQVSSALADICSRIEGPMIICGDFNDVPGSWTYRQFIKAGLQDAYAETGFGHIITYNQHLMYFHIDQILYKGALMPLYVRKGKVKASDHYPLEAEFVFL